MHTAVGQLEEASIKYKKREKQLEDD